MMLFRNSNTIFTIFICSNIFVCGIQFQALHGSVNDWDNNNVNIKPQGINTSSNIQGKIVGGESASIESYPFAVQFLNMGRLCGGAILNSWSIITSAHCIVFNTDRNQMIIQVGARYTYDFTSDSYRVLWFVVHEDYNKEQIFSCDIAIVFVTKPIKLGDRAKKGILVNHNKWMNEKERDFIVTGWGFTKQNGEVSKDLQMAHLRYVSPRECSRLLVGHKLTSDMFCLYGDGKSDTCQGDSGGGVLWNNMLVGLTSHGDGCANDEKPSVYTNLWVLTPWIKSRVIEFIDRLCNGEFNYELKKRTENVLDGIINKSN